MKKIILLLILLGIVWISRGVIVIKPPQYPPQFVSNWTYQLTNPAQELASGWTIWAGFNDTLYYYMSAYGGWEQIVQGNSIYNFCRKQQSCCQDDYGWPIVTDYFANATMIGPLPNDPNTVEWVGSLYTQAVLGSPQTYIVRTQAPTGYPTMYVSATIGGTTANEIMFALSVDYVQGPSDWFQIPTFCIPAPACGSNR